ncbi:MAG: (2Fe-2S)-binding protein [Gemmatimonadetes bacterium]|nr:(2Fe-2S)-binding protein [Gemmatimonadota bacterium]
MSQVANRRVHVNGRWHEIEAPDDMPLLWVLRDLLGLRGTKYGCGRGLCGACTVHIDGVPARACVTAIASLEPQAQITSIEGLEGDVAAALRDAWLSEAVPQCGYCQAGQIMSAAALLRRNAAPSVAELGRALNGNLCRCGTYARIRRAVLRAADRVRDAD